MQATYHGGLTGKARTIKTRNRIERIRAQQLLDEYFDAEDDDQPRQHVRLGSRADFLPTADSWTNESAGFETGGQFELSLEAVATNEIEGDFREEEAGASAAAETVLEAEPKQAVKVIPTPYWAKPKLTFQPQGTREVAKSFDVRRFLCGCALGTAAAAAILMIVSTVVH